MERGVAATFSELVIAYLFLGGAGAGALVVLSVFELEECRGSRWLPGGRETTFALPASLRFGSGRAHGSALGFREVRGCAWGACATVLGVAILCLFADLGRPDRVMGLLTSPVLTPMTVGAYALGAAMTVAAAFALVRLLDNVAIPRAVAAVGAVCGIAVGLVTAAYTGVLLASLAAVLFWQTPLLPVLFTLSALSCGTGLVCACAAFSAERCGLPRMPLAPPGLLRFDRVLIGLEVVALAAYVGWGLASEGTAPAVRALIEGELAGLFWAGVVGCGLVGACTLGVLYGRACRRTGGKDVRRPLLLWVAAALLVGGVSLRICVVGAGAFDVTQMAAASWGLAL